MKITYELFSQAYLNEIFNYNPETGIVRWKHRPRTDFKLARKFKAWNNKYENEEAGQLDVTSGRYKIHIYESSYMLDRLLWKLVYNIDLPKIYHLNGWLTDNRLDNLSAKPGLAPTKYNGGRLELIRDNLGRFLVKAGNHVFTINESHYNAHQNLIVLADKLEADWTDTTKD